jgi:hypothetical protein
MIEKHQIPVDSKVTITDSMLVNHYQESTGIVKQLNTLGTLPIAGIELPSGRFAWIAEYCLSLTSTP